jgi:hypothetical protein
MADKPQNVAKTFIDKIVPFVIPKVAITSIVIDNRMAIIKVKIGKNIVKGVLLNGRYGVNIITK